MTRTDAAPRLTAWRKAAAAGVALVATAALSTTASPASAEPGEELLATLRAAPENLRTPFEQSNGATWTTVDEGQRFWRQLDRSSERVAVTRIGRTVQGRPLQLVQVGAPAPKSLAEAAQGSVLFYNCSIHGDEPSGREACMQLARDLASSDDGAVVSFLENTTVLFLISNPDGWAADTRQNANGVDVNRDLMALASPEGRAIARTIRDWRPDVLNDLHEYGPREFYNTDLLHLWPRNREVDAGVYRLAVSMNNDYSAPLVESVGYTSGIYGLLVKDGEPFLQVAGDEQARILRNYSGLQHVVGMLSETANEALNAEEEADPALLNRRRVEVNYTSAVGSAQFVLENRAEIEQQTEGAATRATVEGATQAGVVYFAGQDNAIPENSNEVDATPMCGYQLTRDQFRELRQTLTLHGISWRRTANGGAFVSMGQPDSPLIPLLFDERSEFRLTQATPLDNC
jgi:hypothetical protein